MLCGFRAKGSKAYYWVHGSGVRVLDVIFGNTLRVNTWVRTLRVALWVAFKGHARTIRVTTRVPGSRLRV